MHNWLRSQSGQSDDTTQRCQLPITAADSREANAHRGVWTQHNSNSRHTRVAGQWYTRQQAAQGAAEQQHSKVSKDSRTAQESRSGGNLQLQAFHGFLDLLKQRLVGGGAGAHCRQCAIQRSC